MRSSVISAASSPLADAVEENLHEHIAFAQRSIAGMTVLDEDDLLLVDAGLASDTFNKIARARLRPPHADRRITEAIAHFRNARRPFAWWIGPRSRPVDLESRLRDHGLEATEHELGMTMELQDLSVKPDYPRGFVVRCVTCAKEIADFARVLAATWGPPDEAVPAFYQSAASLLLREHSPMKLFVGYQDDEAVAVGELLLKGNTGGVYSVATRGVFRGRGYASALTWSMADRARSLGAAIAVLQSADAGKGLYARLGFKACCVFAEYTVLA